MNIPIEISEVLRNSREYLEEVRRERVSRGLPSAFVDPDSAPYNLEQLVIEAKKRGRIEGPSFLTPAQTASAEQIRAGLDPVKSPQQSQWIERLLRHFGVKPVIPTEDDKKAKMK
jgi:hypothetical protein